MLKIISESNRADIFIRTLIISTHYCNSRPSPSLGTLIIVYIPSKANW